MSTYLFTPPTVEEIDWSQGVDKKWRGGYRVEVPASKSWKHFTKGERGRTVIRVGGVYQTASPLTQSLINSADDIRWPDGSLAPAVFLGGHVIEVTVDIAAELVAAGYTVDTVGEPYPALDIYPSTSLYPGENL